VSTRLGPEGLVPVVDEIAGIAGVASELPSDVHGTPDARGTHDAHGTHDARSAHDAHGAHGLRGRVEVAVRRNETEEFWFLINLTAEPVEVSGLDGSILLGGPVLEPRGVAVWRRPAS
jgi:beta-galactosidase